MYNIESIIMLVARVHSIDPLAVFVCRESICCLYTESGSGKLTEHTWPEYGPRESPTRSLPHSYNPTPHTSSFITPNAVAAVTAGHNPAKAAGGHLDRTGLTCGGLRHFHWIRSDLEW